MHTEWVFISKIHTQWCLTHTCMSVTQMRMPHTHAVHLSHTHRYHTDQGVTYTEVSHTCAIHTCAEVRHTHLEQAVHSAECCRGTCAWGCVTHTCMFHTCLCVSHDVFQAKWISHTWSCVTNTHTVTQTYRGVSHTHTHECLTHRVIHTGVTDTHDVSHTISQTHRCCTHTHGIRHCLSHFRHSASRGAFHRHTGVSVSQTR